MGNKRGERGSVRRREWGGGDGAKRRRDDRRATTVRSYPQPPVLQGAIFLDKSRVGET